MSLTKLMIAATVLVAPAAYAKNNSTASATTTVVVTPPTPDGYHGKGSNPSDDDKSSNYGSAKGSNVGPSHSCDKDNTTVYVPDNQYQDDTYYYNAAGYTPNTDISGQKKVNAPRGDIELGLRYAVGKGLEASPELAGAGFYGRIFHPTGRYAAEISFDSLASDPTSGAYMKQGSLLVSYDLFLNPDGIVKPYGSIGMGGTWHGVAGSQNVFGAIALGVGLDVSLGKALSFNLDGRLIADSEADDSTTSGATIAAKDLNAAQEFVVSSAGVSFHW